MRPRHVLPVLVLAQLAGTSLWFAANAVLPDLERAWGWPTSTGGLLTIVLQAGFIVGTLVFALWAVADRYPPKRVFLVSCTVAAVCTAAAGFVLHDLSALMFWRFAAGFCLAGIYPVGMKIAAQWYPQGLGTALGWLLGALILGSASAHAVRAWVDTLGNWPWESVFPAVAFLTLGGGLLLQVALPNAPRVQSSSTVPAQAFDWKALGMVWSEPKIRASVFAYFGHMWELYTMWVAVPMLLAQRLEGAALSWAAFVVLGSGAAGCVLGGLSARRWGSARVAGVLLATSGLCCLVSTWAISASDLVFGAWLVLWGFSVSSDSPQLSALTASNAPGRSVGSLLTLTNCIGFTLSILSISLFTTWAHRASWAQCLPWLAVGPAIGLWMLRPLWRRSELT